jgi:hypothetical protein
MNENDRIGSGTGATPGVAGDRQAFENRLGAEKSAAQTAAADAGRTLKDEAAALGSEAQQAASDQAEKVKETAASQLDGFADALRAASDELGRNQGGPAAELVSNAASGLEGFARSLHGKSTGEMVDKIRQFGRENPIAFLAGSALAGLALGRFATAAAPSGAATRAPASTNTASSSAYTSTASSVSSARDWRPDGEPVRPSVAPEAGAWSTTGGPIDDPR